jgi:hypothetical protein
VFELDTARATDAMLERVPERGPAASDRRHHTSPCHDDAPATHWRSSIRRASAATAASLSATGADRFGGPG